MNTKEKMNALCALDDSIHIRYRETSFIQSSTRELEPWYVSQQVEVKKGSVLQSVSGNGYSVEEAVDHHWESLTNLQPNEYVVVNAGTPQRQAVRWNGFMWKTVREEGKHA